MEALRSMSSRILPALALLTMACTPDDSAISDERMSVALAELEKETGDLAKEFELAASKALANGQTFEEAGNQSGDAVLVDGSYSFGCIKSNDENGTLCEKARIDHVSPTPNSIYLDRDDSSLINVGDNDTDLQVTKRDASGQDSATMFLTENHCGINGTKKGVSSSEYTNSPGIIKRCTTLRDSLRVRFAKVMGIATDLKNKN